MPALSLSITSISFRYLSQHLSSTICHTVTNWVWILSTWCTWSFVPSGWVVWVLLNFWHTSVEFLCFYLPTIWSLVTAFVPEFMSRQQKVQRERGQVVHSLFVHILIFIFLVYLLFIYFFSWPCLCHVFLFCVNVFLVNVSNSLLSLCSCLLLLTCFVHRQEAEANTASLALWRSFGRRESGHGTFFLCFTQSFHFQLLQLRELYCIYNNSHVISFQEFRTI